MPAPSRTMAAVHGLAAVLRHGRLRALLRTRVVYAAMRTTTILLLLPFLAPPALAQPRDWQTVWNETLAAAGRNCCCTARIGSIS